MGHQKAKAKKSSASTGPWFFTPAAFIGYYSLASTARQERGKETTVLGCQNCVGLNLRCETQSQFEDLKSHLAKGRGEGRF